MILRYDLTLKNYQLLKQLIPSIRTS